MNSEQRLLRSRIAVTTRYRPDDLRTIEEARRDLRVSRAESYILALLATTPPPTPSQRARLARLLRSARGEEYADA